MRLLQNPDPVAHPNTDRDRNRDTEEGQIGVVL